MVEKEPDWKYYNEEGERFNRLHQGNTAIDVVSTHGKHILDVAKLIEYTPTRSLVLYYGKD